MKIAILSINLHTKGLNYACPLHSYAFQQYLLKHGIEATILDYKPVHMGKYYVKNPYPYFYYKSMSRRIRKKPPTDPEKLEQYNQRTEELNQELQTWKPIQKERKIRYKKFQEFFKKYYVKTDTLYTADSLEAIDPDFDCYICATDVIWRYLPNSGFDRVYFLNSSCMDNKWKIAYAASTGPHFAEEPEDEEQFFQYVRDFDFVSVRERKLQNYITQNSDIPTTLVLDPVLLHDMDFYQKIAVKPSEEHFILVYTVLETARIPFTIAPAAEFARRYHLKIIELTDRPIARSSFAEYEDIDASLYYAAGIEEWLGCLLYADYVFTNSFHACCFSILFQKDFYAGPRNGDKIENLLQTFHLKHRILSKKGVLPENLEPIDYDKVKKILDKERKKSEDFLLSAIRYAETHEHPFHDYASAKKEIEFPVYYFNGKVKNPLGTYFVEENEKTYKRTTFWKNDGKSIYPPTLPDDGKNTVTGWTVCYKIGNNCYWYLEDGSSCMAHGKKQAPHAPKYICKPGEPVPCIPVNYMSAMMLEPVWENQLSYQLKHLPKLTKRGIQRNFLHWL